MNKQRHPPDAPEETTIDEPMDDRGEGSMPGEQPAEAIDPAHDFGELTAEHHGMYGVEGTGDDFFDERTNPELRFDAVEAAAELDASLAEGQLPAGGSSPGEAYVGILESEVQELGSLLEKSDARLRAAESEIDRARARIERDAERRIEERARSLLLGFIEVLDDLDRAIAAARASEREPAVLEGIELVKKRFLGKLAEQGVEHVPAMGAAFDPMLHEAASMVPVTDSAQHVVVVGVMREGYAIRGETLRPATVAVGKPQ